MAFQRIVLGTFSPNLKLKIGQNYFSNHIPPSYIFNSNFCDHKKHDAQRSQKPLQI